MMHHHVSLFVVVLLLPMVLTQEQPGWSWTVARSPEDCWGTVRTGPTVSESEFAPMTMQCANGTVISSCKCAGPQSVNKLPPNSCSITGWSAVGCGVASCPPGEEFTVVQPAAPEQGRCCPERRCLPIPAPPQDTQSRLVIAKSAEECWGTVRTGPGISESEFSPVTITCGDGTVQVRSCKCAGSQNILPPNSCSNVTSWSGVSCGVWSCPLGQQLAVVQPAAPELGKCCPDRQCLPIITAALSDDQLAMADGATTTSASETPAWAIALIILGTIFLVALIVVNVMLSKWRS